MLAYFLHLVVAVLVHWQRVRVRQSRLSLPLIALMSFTFLVGYYPVTNINDWDWLRDRFDNTAHMEL